MGAKCVEELQVYQKAPDAAVAVSALLESDGLRTDPRLRSQLGASSERVASLIAEGFGQKTDRHFAHYLYLSRGSSKEARTQLAVAHGRRYLAADAFARLSDRYNEIERMLTGLIKHLVREDRQHRG